MEDQATADAETPLEDATESSDSVEAAPSGIEPDQSGGGLLAAAFASVGLTSSDKLEEVLSHEDKVEEPEEPAVEEPVAEAEEPSAEAAEVTPAPEAAVETVEEEEEEEVPVDTGPASPYDLPGDWFVIHSYSGYENKVKANLETRIHSMHMEGEIFDVHIPMEDVVEIKGGRKVTVPKKVFPGYILVRMYLSDDSWFAVRNTPGVTGFVGSGTKPVPLSRREVERILGVKKEETVGKAAPRFQPAWGVGETVRVVEGPFADFNGVIEEINLDQSKVRVLVNIFGRETPVELNFEQIVKL